MLGAMQDQPLLATNLIDHAAREHGSREIVTHWADGTRTRTNWAEIHRDARRMAQALGALDLEPHARIATLAMNHSRHLVSWYGSIGARGVLHTLNPRLFEDQLDYIVNHAEDRVMLYDAVFQPIVDKMRDRWPTVVKYVCYDSGAHEEHFEDWIAPHDGDLAWPEAGERDPCMLCYTSGTTGNPKGVLYEHRSTLLHAMTTLQPNCFDFRHDSAILPVVPMFHAASWGLPWAGAACGLKFVYCANNDPVALYDLMAEEGVTHSAGVPTVWLALFEHCDSNDLPLPELEIAMIGGSAAPRFMIERLMKNGTRVGHAWGMTETSPVASVGTPLWNWDQLSFEEQVDHVCMQGQPLFGVDIRVVDLDDMKTPLPRDGKSAGAIHVRGPWVIRRYFKETEDATLEDNWFPTGDVGVIHPNGTLQLTDRTKDVIKSGGEWISSVELENTAVGHPAVAEAAAIGVYHPKWDERPVLFVVKKKGADLSAEDVLAYMSDKVAKWWLPDAVEFVDELPHTGTGKISKKDLRDRFADYKLVP